MNQTGDDTSHAAGQPACDDTGLGAGHAARAQRDGGLLLRALLIKLIFGGLLVAIAAHWASDSPYLAPREGDANDVVWTLARGFDAHAYQKLALQGFTDDFSRNYPLGFPLMIRAVYALVGNAQTAAVVVSNVGARVSVLLFALVAGVYIRRRETLGLGGAERVGAATLLFMTTPGWLVFGTVAYSEGPFLALALGAWWAYLKAEERAPHSGAVPPRDLGWLTLYALLALASVMLRHAGGTLLLAVGLVEGVRVLCAHGGRRGRALIEACAACWTALPLAGYFWWKHSAHDLAGLQQRIWGMGFSPLGGLPSLVQQGISPEHIAQIYATVPIMVWLLLRARRIDGRLTLIGLVSLFVLMSYTGTAAQSLMRYAWTLWPVSLGALAVRDRGAVWALAGLLFCISVLIGAGHVLGTAAL